MSRRWDAYDANPRRSYYLFLRAVYGMLAFEAWREVNKWIPKGGA